MYKQFYTRWQLLRDFYCFAMSVHEKRNNKKKQLAGRVSLETEILSSHLPHLIQ